MMITRISQSDVLGRLHTDWERAERMRKWEEKYTVQETHELRPRADRGHETLTVRFIGSDAWLGAINGTWKDGWDFPTEYDYYTKERK